MTLQTYNMIKLKYNSYLSVELDYNEKYEVGNIYHFNDDYECKGIIKNIKHCKEYSTGKTFLKVKLL